METTPLLGRAYTFPMTKIYTKGGDKGETGLFDGTRVSKNHVLVNAYGTVDELNSVLGIARSWHAQLPDKRTAVEDSTLGVRNVWNLVLGIDKMPADADSACTRLDTYLHTIQVELFQLGADLASGAPQAPRFIHDGMVERFEQWIDELTAGLPELKNFILPTGHPVAAALHQCRTVSRRAERMIIAARETVEIDSVIVRYVNRLADLFFVLAREANRIYGVQDEPWTAPKP